MFIYDAQMPERPTFAPNLDSMERADDAAQQLWQATDELRTFRDNANNEWGAKAEAYKRRNQAIFEATGVQLENPMTYDVLALKPTPGAGGLPEPAARDDIAAQETAWLAKVRELATERPEFAGVIAADRPIVEDAFAITRQAEPGFAAADAEALAAGLSPVRRMANILGGGVAGMLRDPLQVTSLFAGGGVSGGARTVAGRIFSMMFTEAAVNAGVEAAVQASAQDYKRRAGVDSGFGDALQQVGIAALFGGGFGGLFAGAGEVLRLTGKAVPPEVLQRATMGTPEPGDVRVIAESLGLQLDPQAEKVAELAAVQPALDRAAFGDAPAEIPPAAAESLAATAIRAIEEPADSVPDAQARFEAIDRIVKQQQPLGRPPRKPVTLMQFLAGRSVGGIRDESGELAAMGLSKQFVPGAGAMSMGKTVTRNGKTVVRPPRFVAGAGAPLVRPTGKRLDMAREAAAEAGYFDDLYGDPDRAIAESTVDDLLRLLRQEAGGEPVLSSRNDGGRQFEWLEYEAREKAQEAYRRLVGRVDSAAQTVGLDAIDDAVLVRAAELVDDETDELAALERALDEDYRSYADAYAETGAEPFDDLDIPFFDQDPGANARAGAADGGARGEGLAAGRGADAPPGGPLPRAGDDERGVRQLGETPEPGTSEAGEIAALARAEAAGATVSEKSGDLWDAMPAAKKADGSVSHVTHAELVEDADRDGSFADLISSCKD